jgi:threonine/homoserine/homoserine lactone efflux protein
MGPTAVAGFVVAVAPLIATPGASLALLTDRLLADRTHRATPVILGTITGLYVHAVFAAAGLSTLVLGSDRPLQVVRLVGAAYLVLLGIWTLWTHRRDTTAPTDTTSQGETGYRQALLANVLNPKAASIFLTLMPQFMDAGTPLPVQFAVLATAQAVLISIWLAAWAIALRYGRRALASPRVLRALQLAGAMVLVALGVRTALVA